MMKFNRFDYDDLDLELLKAECLPDEDSEYFKTVYNELEAFLGEYFYEEEL